MTSDMGSAHIAGGLKLALRTGESDDRKIRFVAVRLMAGDGEGIGTELVTDARGRMRYPLPSGSYRLHVDDQDVRFDVREGRWTPVRVQLS